MILGKKKEGGNDFRGDYKREEEKFYLRENETNMSFIDFFFKYLKLRVRMERSWSYSGVP